MNNSHKHVYKRGSMPLYKSAQAQTANDEVVIYQPESHHSMDTIEVEEPQGFHFDFPSIPKGDLEVSEQDNDNKPAASRKHGPKDIWDWQAYGIDGLLGWVQERITHMPTHTGETAGIERLIAYLKRLNGEISKAISTDFEGKIDVKTLEGARRWIHESINTLEDAQEKLIEKHYKKHKAASTEGGMVKEARTPYNGGIVVTVPILISRCARVCINGTVSAGHDLESLFNEQVKKYALSTREQAELIQHIEDMGFIIKSDRLFLPEEEVEITNGRGDLASNYPA